MEVPRRGEAADRVPMGRILTLPPTPEGLNKLNPAAKSPS